MCYCCVSVPPQWHTMIRSSVPRLCTKYTWACNFNGLHTLGDSLTDSIQIGTPWFSASCATVHARSCVRGKKLLPVHSLVLFTPRYAWHANLHAKKTLPCEPLTYCKTVHSNALLFFALFRCVLTTIIMHFCITHSTDPFHNRFMLSLFHAQPRQNHGVKRHKKPQRS